MACLAALFLWTPQIALASEPPSACAAASCSGAQWLEIGLRALELGQAPAAAEAASAAFAAAQDHLTKQRAARLAAAAHARQGQYLRAQIWLRRAANHATDQATADQIRSEFRALRAESPLRLSFDAGIAASDNINGGARSSQFFLGDIELELAPSALALSGTELTGAFDLDYRLSQSATQRTSLGLSGFGRSFVLSGAAKAQAPSARGGDYALAQLGVSLRHQRILNDRLGPTAIALSLGRTWYGGAPLWGYQRLDLAQEFKIGQAATLTVRGRVENREALSVGEPDAQLFGFGATYAQRLGNEDVFTLSYSGRMLNADIATYEYRFHEVAAEYRLAQPIWGASLSFRAALSQKTYDEFSLSLSGRHDKTATLSATALFNQISRFGFSPRLTIAATRTDSDVSRFSTQGLQASFGIQSTF
ncbi:hypothetical protein N6L24_06675 [Cognatishimia sp. SS12]|uniref:hypothetical protein n=1 Tax=Cognatishimia sp. SS12 TaxID=2979465 RepID=UPI00232D8A6E|nr:hypothetical protein [Cognatishimia sp. SS12]MDC0737956.1 hypothetical protein [Cognatishimia sp. SS12]